jgi:alpha-L-fucosidase
MKQCVNLIRVVFILLTVLGFIVIVRCSNKVVQTEPAKEKTEIITKWQNLKYGMFIHFSMNNFAGFEYDAGNLPSSKYTPTNLDVKQWVHTAKLAGMSYAVLTAKHQSGFCLWDSKVMWKGKEYDYDVANSNYKTDVVAEFMAACHEEGIKPGLYYCISDPHNEGTQDGYAKVKDEYFQLIKGQIEELHTHYKGIVEQWIDIPAKLSVEQRFELYRLIKRFNPECLISCNNGFSDGVTVLNWPVDLVNGERTLPPASGHNPLKTIDSVTYYIPMEVCQTLCQNWFSMPWDQPKLVTTLYYWYEQSLKRGANLLLDVPPDNTGRIPQNLVDRLVELKKIIDNPALLPKPKSLTYRKPSNASTTWLLRQEYTPEYAFDEDSTTRWVGSIDIDTAWLEVDLEKEVPFNRVLITEQCTPCIHSFELQYKNGNEWKTILSIKDFKGVTDQKFKSVTARHVRILITKFSVLSNPENVLRAPGTLAQNEGPGISEFQLFNQ